MKIKTDFVTNSSSTNYMFIFKGNTKEELYTILKKYSDSFNLEHEDYDKTKSNITVKDIIDSIEECIDQILPDYVVSVKIKPIDILIEKIRKIKKSYENHDDNDWYDEIIMRYLKLYDSTKTAKKIGLNSYLEIEFGDNDGHICGGRIGDTMDYEGRHIRLSNDEIMLLTDGMR